MQLYGFHAVTARLRQRPEGVAALYIDLAREDGRMRDLVQLAERLGVPLHRVDARRLEGLAPHRRHQGVVALVEASPSGAQSLPELLETIPKPRLLLLDGVTDPRNLGACLRVADGAGIHAVIAPKDHSCPLNEAAIQTASGAADSVPYLLVTNLARTVDTLQERGLTVLGTDDAATESLWTIAIPESVAWVLGAEGKGLRRLTRERCDALVSIPMAGQVSSLNVAVAAGVVLYETARRHACAPQTP